MLLWWNLKNPRLTAYAVLKKWKFAGELMSYKTNIAAGVSNLFCGFFFSSNAYAGFDVNKLKSDCESQSEGKIYCLGRVSGIFEMMQLNATNLTAASNGRTRILAVCKVQGGPSNGAVAQIFLNWANAHPEKWSEPDLVGVVTALSKTWPCR